MAPTTTYVHCGPAACTPGYERTIARHFITKDEKVARLEAYANDLENELKGVRERIEAIGSD